MTIITVGDSWASGMCNNMDRHSEGLPALLGATNLASAGSRAVDWRGKIRQVLEGLTPTDLVIVSIGGNDFRAAMRPDSAGGRWVTGEEHAACQSAIAAVMRQLPVGPRYLVMLYANPYKGSAAWTERLVGALAVGTVNGAIRNACTGRGDIAFIDAEAILNHDCFSKPDIMHPNTAGHQRLAEYIKTTGQVPGGQE